MEGHARRVSKADLPAAEFHSGGELSGPQGGHWKAVTTPGIWYQAQTAPLKTTETGQRRPSVR